MNMIQKAIIYAAVGSSGLLGVTFGAWAFFGPESFFESIATFPPYNLHFMHDLGALQLGIGAALLGALVWHDALLVALQGGTIAAGFHFVAHVLDRDIGGRASDPWTLGALAVLPLVALILRARSVRMPHLDQGLDGPAADRRGAVPSGRMHD